MAGISGFEYNVFISYAHLDNATSTDDEIGWIDLFCKKFDLQLRQIHGSNAPRIWWDEKRLDGSIVFNKSIEAGVRKSALMLCLTSNAYKESKYCKEEREIFHQT